MGEEVPRDHRRHTRRGGRAPHVVRPSGECTLQVQCALLLSVKAPGISSNLLNIVTIMARAHMSSKARNRVNIFQFTCRI